MDMEANRVSLTEQGRGDAGADEDSKVHVRIRAHTETETEKEQETLDDGLFVFLKRLRVTPQAMSDLARDRESFGLAWLTLLLFAKSEALGKVSVAAPRSVDLSGIRNISRTKIFLLLDVLQSSVEEVNLDSGFVKGPSLPLFLRFLEGLQAGRGRGAEEGKAKRSAKLRSFVFDERSLGPEEALKVLPLILAVPSLESLSLKGGQAGTNQCCSLSSGKRVGVPGFEVISEGIREGRGRSLLNLDLSDTGLDIEGLKEICSTIKKKQEEGKPLRVERLDLSNISGRKDTVKEHLGPVLCTAALPSLRHLLLAWCSDTMGRGDFLFEALGKGELSKLESLNLVGSRVSLGGLGRVLKDECVPCLKELKIDVTEGEGQTAEDVGVFIQALRASEKPPRLENVQVHLNSSVSDEHLRSLAVGSPSCVRSLCLTTTGRKTAIFLRELVEAAEAERDTDLPAFEVLNLRICLVGVGNEEDVEVFTWLDRAVRLGRLGCLRKVDCTLPESLTSRVSEFEAPLREFLRSLTVSVMPRLSELSLPGFVLTDADLVLLGEAVRKGNVPVLESLNLSRWGGGGGGGVVG